MFGSIRTAIIAASAPNSWTDAQQQDTSPWGYHSSIIYRLYSFVDRTVKVHIPPPANSKNNMFKI